MTRADHARLFLHFTQGANAKRFPLIELPFGERPVTMVGAVSEQDFDLGSSKPADNPACSPDFDMWVVSAELISGLNHEIER